jgi:hypothetical protein
MLILGKHEYVGANLVFARLMCDHKDRPYKSITAA